MTAASTDPSAARARGRDSRPAAGLWPPPRDSWPAAAAVGLIYVAHLAYGALVSSVALVVTLVAALLLAAAVAHPRLRSDLAQAKGLRAPGALFLLTVAVALWTLTPWTPGGPHPVWEYAGLPSGSTTVDRSSTIVEIIKLLGLACIFLLGAVAGARDERARHAVRLTLLAGLAFALWAFIATASGALYSNWARRLEANFLDANTAATVFAALVPLAVWSAWRDRTGGRWGLPAVVAGCAALTFLVCLTATASRGGFVALLAGGGTYLGLLLLTGKARLGRAMTATLAALAGLTLILAVTGELLVDRLLVSGEDVVDRTAIWSLHWRAFLDSPLLGYGLGSFETVHKIVLNPAQFGALWPNRAALNVYLQWLEEAGILGALPMFACIGAILLATVRGALRRSRMVPLLCALLAVDVVFLVHGSNAFSLQTPSVALFWSWLLGLQFSLAQGSSRR